MFLHTHIYLFDFDPDFPHDPYTVQKNASKGRLELLKILVHESNIYRVFIQMKNINAKTIIFLNTYSYSLIPSFDNHFSPMFHLLVKTTGIKTHAKQLNL